MDTQLNNGRVIVTYGRSLIALMIAQSLGQRGVDIIGCDDVSMTVLSFSKYVSKNCIYTAADQDENAFINDLVTIATENKPEDDRPYILIPAFRDAKILAKYKHRFDGIITLASPDYQAIEKVDYKDAFAKTTKKLNVASPKTWLPKDAKDLEAHMSDIPYPVFIKPPNDVGGRGISKIEDEQQLRTEFSMLQDAYPGEQIIIQALCKGVDYCFCGLFDNGHLVTSMVYHNLHKFPNESGQGVVRETVESERFDAIAQQLMGPLKWNGVAGIDFMWDEDENSIPNMIEVNPRFWAGLDHSLKSNVDFPWLLYRLFVDGHVEADDDVAIGHKTKLPGLSTLSRIEALLGTSFNFEKLHKKWPQITKNLKNHDIKQATKLFKQALDDSLSFREALHIFMDMTLEAKQADSIAYGDDDPFVGLGFLFVLSSLIKHGELPPEVKY